MNRAPASPSDTVVQGVYFDGRSSRPHPAELTLGAQGAALRVVGGGVAASAVHWQAAQVTVDPSIPGVRRRLKFPDGSRFETDDDAALRRWEAQSGHNRVLRGVRGLEGRWTTALGALVVAGALGAAFVVWGIPALATQAALVTPRSVLATFDRQTIELLDTEDYMGPSKLSAARQAQLQAAFAPVRDWAGGGYSYRLLLRDGKPSSDLGLGANAFALPGGTIVMTDQLVKLARSDRELVGVLAHETAHVTRRHGVATVYQALGVSLVVTLLTGDLVSAGTFAAAVPATLLRSGYSRAAESEADRIAAGYLLRVYGTTVPLQTMLAQLEKEASKDGEDSGGSWLDLLSSHPVTRERIEDLRALEAVKQ
ncbi:M48 family metallopeptidase [Deinococcus multiflagellatus]|uniref:M48 family metallopeptidase n=1 Tax=Deinococcus multiflagellatus TaxID=1656887 RepID=A0ABW1ZGV7_9DEIO|nr:M48 family metallopeptidase [Deinococcus multiflagellatus]MBZ9711799.1 M48 family metallopeptidase [Deinococcus multiflagellatus]